MDDSTPFGFLPLTECSSPLMADLVTHILPSAQEYFITLVDDYGPLGYLAYAAVYTALEVLAGGCWWWKPCLLWVLLQRKMLFVRAWLFAAAECFGTTPTHITTLPPPLQSPPSR